MLGIAIRWIIDSIRDIFAKKSLEDKLGRKVASHEIYSLSANIEAAEETPQQAAPPLQPAAPPQPMSKTTKIVLASVAGGFLLLAGAGVLFLVVMMMPEATYNRLNPFTPKVPAGAFPPSIAGRDLVAEPSYDNKSYCPCYSFSGQYKNAKDSIYYVLVVFKTPEEAVKKMKERYFIGGLYKTIEQTDSRMVSADPKSSGVTTSFTVGNYLIYYSARSASESVEFENALPYAALGMAQPPPRVAPVADVPTATPLTAAPKPPVAKKATP